jgi:hypothetical protein
MKWWNSQPYLYNFDNSGEKIRRKRTIEVTVGAYQQEGEKA